MILYRSINILQQICPTNKIRWVIANSLPKFIKFSKFFGFFFFINLITSIINQYFLTYIEKKITSINCLHTVLDRFFNELSLLDLSLLGVRERFLSILLGSSFLEWSLAFESKEFTT